MSGQIDQYYGSSNELPSEIWAIDEARDRDDDFAVLRGLNDRIAQREVFYRACLNASRNRQLN